MDPEEIRRLLRIIKENGHQSMYLPETRRELDDHDLIGNGERVMGPLEVVPLEKALREDPETVLACITWQPGEMLVLPDNLTAPCAWGCGRTVQFRPWAPPELPRVCLYCMAERKKKDN